MKKINDSNDNLDDLDAQKIIDIIATSKKKTPVKVYFNSKGADKLDFSFPNCLVYGTDSYLVVGEWSHISPVLRANQEKIQDVYVESDRRNSAIPLLDTKELNARIEPGAYIRDNVSIGDNAIIMMGAIINIGAVIGKGTMIDMGAVIGGRAIVGDNCHVGAGVVLAGVIEPASATPVIVEDDVLLGANSVVLEGVRIAKGSVIAAGSVVTRDTEPGGVYAGIPARKIKEKDEQTKEKTSIVDDLRKL